MNKKQSLNLMSYKTVHLVLFALLIAFTACSTRWGITDPYEQVDWKKDGQYKANLHTHTTNSDGHLAPNTVVDRYHQLGYQILALTDHNAVTYPWTAFASMKPAPHSEKLLAEGRVSKDDLVYQNRDPRQLGMIAIQGNEVSSPHHVNSLFNDYNHPTLQEDSAFTAVAARNGLIIINHPGRYKHNAQWYIDFYRKYGHLKGMEIYNNGDRYPNDRQLWDSVLVALLPDRPVWAYSNDDMHQERSLGRNWNIFVLPELSEEWVRKGIEEGRSFYVYSPEGRRTQSIPEIHAVRVDQKKGRIQLIVTGQDSISWISGGKVVQKGSSVRLKDCPELSAYVRAEIFGPRGVVMGTQPFIIQKK
jgi:hypothetical protein